MPAPLLDNNPNFPVEAWKVCSALARHMKEFGLFCNLKSYLMWILVWQAFSGKNLNLSTIWSIFLAWIAEYWSLKSRILLLQSNLGNLNWSHPTYIFMIRKNSQEISCSELCVLWPCKLPSWTPSPCILASRSTLHLPSSCFVATMDSAWGFKLPSQVSMLRSRNKCAQRAILPMENARDTGWARRTAELFKLTQVLLRAHQ